MSDEAVVADALDARARQGLERREFFRAIGAAAAVGGGLALAAGPAVSQTAGGDPVFLNLALQIEYLEAQFFSYASFGTGLPDALLGGKGTKGTVYGGRAVQFDDRRIAQFAREIAQDERNHVEFLRATIGNSAVAAQPNIDIRATVNGAFSTAFRGAGLIGADEGFDPYASDENFLLAAFYLEDLVVTAYAGLAARVADATSVDAIAGLAAAEGYHAGMIRSAIYRKSLGNVELRRATVALSEYRDSLDGSEDQDQGVFRAQDTANVAPLDDKGRVFRRTPGETLNVLFQSAEAVRRGGFFPNGVNGTVIESEDQTEDEE